MALRWYERLGGAVVDQVRSLAADAQRVDGAPALNDDALMGLGRPGRHLVATDASGDPIGYAQLADGTGQLVVAPDARRAGVGTALLRELLAATASGQVLSVWAFGNGAGARTLAERNDLTPGRTLLLMGRDLATPLPEVADPPDVSFRAFAPGADDAAWLAVNARAFADHPEQGRMTQADLDARKAADWFDPAGFILAEGSDQVDQQLLGYHWTKSHDSDTGEVYVLGVDPAAGGRGLGTALLDHGVRHLRATGHRRVILYVEADHEAVVRLYRRYGFTETGRDVMYTSR